MRREPIVLFDNGSHQCLCFDDLVSGEGVQSNQFLIVDNGQYLLLDPGGDLTYTPLSLELSKRFPLQELDYIFASHQDPDIIAALDKWLLHTRARVICSKLWARFLPHLTANYLAVSHGINTYDRVMPLPDRGQAIALGDCSLKAIPAHFLHSVGNFQLYDPVSKILFSATWAPRWWTTPRRSVISPRISSTWTVSIAATWRRTRSAACGRGWSGTWMWR